MTITQLVLSCRTRLCQGVPPIAAASMPAHSISTRMFCGKSAMARSFAIYAAEGAKPRPEEEEEAIQLLVAGYPYSANSFLNDARFLKDPALCPEAEVFSVLLGW